MKKINSILLLTLSVLILSTSCNKDDDDGINVGGDGCTASWIVDGVDYSEDDMTLCVYFDDVLNLSSSATGGNFQLQVEPITGTGTYVADPNDQDLTVYVSVMLNDGTTLVSSNVTVIVTELSNSKARGTFSGDFFDLMDINQSADFSLTDGEFIANF